MIPQMNASCTTGDRHIGAVIDQNTRPVRANERAHSAGQRSRIEPRSSNLDEIGIEIPGLRSIRYRHPNHDTPPFLCFR